MPQLIRQRTFDREGQAFDFSLFADERGYRVAVCLDGEEDCHALPMRASAQNIFDGWQFLLTDGVHEMRLRLRGQARE